MRLTLLCLLLFLAFQGWSQGGQISQKQFVDIEMAKLTKYLNTPELTLSNEQILKLTDLMEEKYAKVEKTWTSGLSKLDMSNQRTKIDHEYTPRVESILTASQRAIIYRNTAGSKQ